MYVSVDIETTGLSLKSQILQVAMVKFDHPEIMKCCHLDFVIKHEKIHGEPYALWLNARLIEIIKDGGGLTIHEAAEEIDKFLPKEKVFVVGKNFGSFDRQFLIRDFPFLASRFHHRSVDVGSLYADEKGVPSLGAINKDDHGIKGNAHEALYDARVALYYFKEGAPKLKGA